jgi:Flp pilus assembly CpaE family ATPase
MISTSSAAYDFVVIDIDKRLDEINLRVFDGAETIYVVMTADLSCLKNVRLVLETLANLGYRSSKVRLVLKPVDGLHGHQREECRGRAAPKIDHEVVNEYRGAISALNSGAPVLQAKADSLLGRSILELAREVDTESTGEPSAWPCLPVVANRDTRAAWHRRPPLSRILR